MCSVIFLNDANFCALFGSQHIPPSLLPIFIVCFLARPFLSLFSLRSMMHSAMELDFAGPEPGKPIVAAEDAAGGKDDKKKDDKKKKK